MAVQIITDTTCNLSEEVLQKLYAKYPLRTTEIVQIPLHITFDEGTSAENETSNEVIYKSIKKNSAIPSTSQAALKDLYQGFLAPVSRGDEVVAIFISSQLSGTYNAALLARKMVLESFPEASIEIIDSQGACMGFAVSAAAEAAFSGCDVEQALEIATKVIASSRFIFFPETLEYLKRGGRINEVKALLGKIIGFRPLLTLEKGQVKILEIVRTRQKAIKKLSEYLLNDGWLNSITEVVVGHVQCTEEARTLAAHIEENLGIPTAVVEISPVVALHLGPGALGIGYCRKPVIFPLSPQ